MTEGLEVAYSLDATCSAEALSVLTPIGAGSLCGMQTGKFAGRYFEMGWMSIGKEAEKNVRNVKKRLSQVRGVMDRERGLKEDRELTANEMPGLRSFIGQFSGPQVTLYHKYLKQ